MTAYATGGAKLYIGTTIACDTTAEFAADTYTEIKEVSDVSEFGDAAEVINFMSIDADRIRKAKGSMDSGSIDLTVARDPADAGQIMLRAAVSSKSGFNFKVELTDKPAGASAKNSAVYFNALVMSGKIDLGTANDITRQKFALALTGEPLTVLASAS